MSNVGGLPNPRNNNVDPAATEAKSPGIVDRITTAISKGWQHDVSSPPPSSLEGAISKVVSLFKGAVDFFKQNSEKLNSPDKSSLTGRATQDPIQKPIPQFNHIYTQEEANHWLEQLKSPESQLAALRQFWPSPTGAPPPPNHTTDSVYYAMPPVNNDLSIDEEKPEKSSSGALLNDLPSGEPRTNPSQPSAGPGGGVRASPNQPSQGPDGVAPNPNQPSVGPDGVAPNPRQPSAGPGGVAPNPNQPSQGPG